MKTNFKRLAALVLTLCMLASVMVPVAFAEDAAVEAPAASVTVAETYPIRLVDMTQTDYTQATGYSKWFKGSSGWKNIAMSAIVEGKLDTEYAAGNLNWRYIGTNDSKYMYYPTVMMQPRLTDKNTWAALQIRVSEDGRYALNLHTDKTVDEETEVSAWTNVVSEWKGDVTAYIFPLADLNAAIAAGAETNAAVEGLMTEANCVGTQTLAANATDVTFNKVRMEEGEYVVVYSATAVTYSISEMTLLEDAADAAMYETEQVVTYPIRFIDPTVDPTKATYPATRFVTGGTAYTNRAYSAITALVDELYEAGDLNWKFLAQDATAAAVYRTNTAMQLRSAQNGLVALQIDVPQAGYYALTVGVDRNTDYTYVTQTYAATAFDVSAYLIKASADVAVTADNIASLAVEENSVGAVSLAADVSSAQFEKTYLEAGSYVLIYSLSAQANISEFGLAQRKIDMPLTGEGATVTQHIELNAFESDDSTLAAAAAGTYADISEYVNTAYAAGSMDWKIENYADAFTDGNFSFVAGKGLKAASPANSNGDWFALRIRVAQSGNYSLNLVSAGDSMQFAVYMFPADAETMSADAIAAQMTSENGLYFQEYAATSTDAKISAGYMEGEYILAFLSQHPSKSRTVYLDDIILESENFTAEDVQFYNFNVFDESNTGYYEMFNQTRYDATKVDGVTTYTEVSADTGAFDNYIKNEDDTYTAIYNLIYQNGYPKTLNWRPDAVNQAATDASSLSESKYYVVNNVDPTAGNVMKVDLNNNKSVGTTQYGSFMLRVDKAGTYNLNITGGANSSLVKIYFVDSFVHNAANGTIYMTNNAVLSDILTNGTGLVTEDYVTLSKTTTNVGQVTVDAAGDYLIVFETKDEPINQDNDEKDKTTVDDIFLTSITLEPVIEEAAARIGNENYTSFDAALSAVEAGDTITLLDNAVAAEVSLGENVTLNLNGYALTANAVDAIAPGAQIIDAGDGIGKLRASALELNEDNAQLPLYNGIGDYYCFYNVDVQAVATTGSGNASKYWFKINFSNEAALALIGEDTELRIQAQLSGVYSNKNEELAGTNFAAIASADAAFSYMWAAKSNSYITVSAVGSSGIDSFELKPAVTANGVVISGDAMARNA